MLEETDLRNIARRIKTAQDAARQIFPISAESAGFDDAAAYHVAGLIHQARLAEGYRPVGRKIGFTNRAIWPVYNVHQPIWGYMYDRTVRHIETAGATCTIRGFAEPRLEPEIVLKFSSAPAPDSGLREILACVEWVAHGIEIVQSHFPGWSFASTDTIADSGLHGALLVGPPRRVGEMKGDVVTTLERLTLTLRREGVAQDTGLGANVLGSPLAAIAHLLALLAAQPRARALQAGEIVTTGTLTQAWPIKAGETWSTELAGIDLPGLGVTFTD